MSADRLTYYILGVPLLNSFVVILVQRKIGIAHSYNVVQFAVNAALPYPAPPDPSYFHCLSNPCDSDHDLLERNIAAAARPPSAASAHSTTLKIITNSIGHHGHNEHLYSANIPPASVKQIR